ncbi:hypothetical protein IGI04_028419 [Brassica rapa subsp. trilocularis]|uniref:UspA domain-containing protein n=1 Tax=Brassica rapa subsp. trilocularis TaxID=1813537 RepID=A0ABQ7L2W2_BRACM|nr:hypothetical protein IGI04_028419 [Brassica rapa subsp. trilocularis]
MAEEKSGKKQVMVAIDESDCSKHALRWTLSYLKDSLADSDIILFTAQPQLDLSSVYASSYGAARKYSPSSVSRLFNLLFMMNVSDTHARAVHKLSVLFCFLAAIELINSMQQNYKNAALNRIEEGTKICAESGVTPKKVMEFGNPKEAICDAVEKLGVDLLIVGSHGKGALERTFLGSVSNYCVNKAKCPVLVVRTKG